MNDPSDLRISDVLTFMAVARLGSVTGAARDLKVTPSQVSKAVARLEGHLGAELLDRKARRVVLSDEAERFIPRMEGLLQSIRALTDEKQQQEQRMTIAAPSYLASAFLPVVAAAAPEVRLRALEVVPSFMRAFATENLFDMALTIGAEKVPGAWVSIDVGAIHRSLFGSPAAAQALGTKPGLAALSAHKFIMPVYNSGGEFVPGEDGCPLARGRRTFGHEASTIGVALELAAQTDQLVFGPTIAARHLLAAGKLVEIRVPGWRITDNLFLHSHGDRVRASTQREIASALRLATSTMSLSFGARS